MIRLQGPVSRSGQAERRTVKQTNKKGIYPQWGMFGAAHLVHKKMRRYTEGPSYPPKRKRHTLRQTDLCAAANFQSGQGNKSSKLNLGGRARRHTEGPHFPSLGSATRRKEGTDKVVDSCSTYQEGTDCSWPQIRRSGTFHSPQGGGPGCRAPSHKSVQTGR